MDKNKVNLLLLSGLIIFALTSAFLFWQNMNMKKEDNKKAVEQKIIVEKSDIVETFEKGNSTEIEELNEKPCVNIGNQMEYACISEGFLENFYIGVYNPITINSNSKNLSVKISGCDGFIVLTGPNKYDVHVLKRGKATLTVYSNGRILTEKNYRCMPTPNPYPCLWYPRNKGGIISKESLLEKKHIRSNLEDFVFDLSFPVTEFTVSATIDGVIQESNSTSSAITEEQKEIFRQLKSGDKVYFENIKALAPDGTIRELNPLMFKIE
ncbi:MAG: hypothetical protein JXL97_13570 [Bacteroidales bacterium]|nr:hypothetical protein [Bacteroidales bacterium]